ncbi:hypothetical protein B5807_11730 [Epicoccum nigrum]|uniref:C2H2-type domain-containing protein n=1 Tax=Epicoccum nigrum TaxID=105696 RepID=A0A1Y2LL54_EPING|nr:hypothetical protein B5807_11730 [Epicoccum nigrum]
MVALSRRSTKERDNKALGSFDGRSTQEPYEFYASMDTEVQCCSTCGDETMASSDLRCANCGTYNDLTATEAIGVSQTKRDVDGKAWPVALSKTAYTADSEDEMPEPSGSGMPINLPSKGSSQSDQPPPTEDLVFQRLAVLEKDDLSPLVKPRPRTSSPDDRAFPSLDQTSAPQQVLHTLPSNQTTKQDQAYPEEAEAIHTPLIPSSSLSRHSEQLFEALDSVKDFKLDGIPGRRRSWKLKRVCADPNCGRSFDGSNARLSHYLYYHPGFVTEPAIPDRLQSTQLADSLRKADNHNESLNTARPTSPPFWTDVSNFEPHRNKASRVFPREISSPTDSDISRDKFGVKDATLQLQNMFQQDERLFELYQLAVKDYSPGLNNLQYDIVRLIERMTQCLNIEANEEMKNLTSRFITQEARRLVLSTLADLLQPTRVNLYRKLDKAKDTHDDHHIDEKSFDDLTSFQAFLIKSNAFKDFQLQLSDLICRRSTGKVEIEDNYTETLMFKFLVSLDQYLSSTWETTSYYTPTPPSFLRENLWNPMTFLMQLF